MVRRSVSDADALPASSEPLSFAEILDSGWPLFGAFLMLSQQVQVDLHLSHISKVRRGETGAAGAVMVRGDFCDRTTSGFRCIWKVSVLR